jgi:acyl carrier protein
MNDVAKVINQFIVTEVMHGSSDELLDLDRPLLDEGILDSLGLQQLITFLEGKYDIMVDDDYLMPEYFTSIRTISELINSLLK